MISNALRNSFVKIDYDTLFIYSESETTKEIINDGSFTQYIINLIAKKLDIPILKVLNLEIDKNDTISFVA